MERRGPRPGPDRPPFVRGPPRAGAAPGRGALPAGLQRRLFERPHARTPDRGAHRAPSGATVAARSGAAGAPLRHLRAAALYRGAQPLSRALRALSAQGPGLRLRNRREPENLLRTLAQCGEGDRGAPSWRAGARLYPRRGAGDGLSVRAQLRSRIAARFRHTELRRQLGGDHDPWLGRAVLGRYWAPEP